MKRGTPRVAGCVCCSVLQHSAAMVLQHTATRCHAQGRAPCTLQCAACSMLAVVCSTLQLVVLQRQHGACPQWAVTDYCNIEASTQKFVANCSVLQCIPCSALQCVVTHCLLDVQHTATHHHSLQHPLQHLLDTT